MIAYEGGKVAIGGCIAAAALGHARAAFAIALCGFLLYLAQPWLVEKSRIVKKTLDK